MKWNTLNISHETIKKFVSSGDICIDATAGRGFDTAFLSELVGETGKVFAFDIQQEAIDSTNLLLQSKGLHNVSTILDSHTNMDKYVSNGVSCITFNFGWLPKGDHSVCTHADTSIVAIDKGLNLLKDNGIMSLCIYYGKDTGFAERDDILNHLQTIDSKKYTVLVTNFSNRPNCPPIFALIIKAI